MEETINICVDQLFLNNDKVNDLSKTEIHRLHSLVTAESYFIFDGEYYKQLDGVAMGSPLGPTLANAFLCYHEKKWLDNCPIAYKPLYYRRYVDDIFVLFSSPEHLQLFKDYLNQCHKNMSFTSESEVNNSMSFLDVRIETRDKCLSKIYF